MEDDEDYSGEEEEGVEDEDMEDEEEEEEEYYTQVTHYNLHSRCLTVTTCFILLDRRCNQIYFSPHCFILLHTT